MNPGLTVGSPPVAKPLLETIRGQRQSRPPIWIMRQAGRYLPEYRALRATEPDFMRFCYNPELTTEATLQPLRRFDLDAAIIFSDILVIPDALGQPLRFEAGEGPVLEPLTVEAIGRLSAGDAMERLAPVLETVRRVRAALAPEKTLIGFCGAPWTLATYMIGGRGSPDQAAARLFALREPEAFARLMAVLVEASIAYLVAQLDAGADCVQIFESWALNLDQTAFKERVIAATRDIVAGVHKQNPKAVIIGFPRGAAGLLPAYAIETKVNAIGLDFANPPRLAAAALPAGFPIQGNLDPLRVVAGGAQMEQAAREIIAAFADRPHIFNLGHGIVPETPVEHVEALIRIVKEG